MNKKLLAVALVILVFIGGSLAFLLLQKDETKTKKKPTQSTSTAQTTPSEATDSPAPEDPGQYVTYEENAIATTPGTKLLFFHAPWCPQCRALEADIQAKGVPNGVTIFKTDYDTNQGLRQKYGVTIQTTFVEVDENGSLIEKFVAYDEPTLSSVKENLLQ